MSKIGTEIVVGQIFKPIVTTFNYDELSGYRNENVSVGINNGLIISIPQENGEDDWENTSIWATDESGFLCPLSFPYSVIKNIQASLENYNRNVVDRHIVAVEWDGLPSNLNNPAEESEEGLIPNITYKAKVYYEALSPELRSVIGIKVYRDRTFTDEYINHYVNGKLTHWYDIPGDYYIQGLVTDTTTGAICSTLNDKPLIWRITRVIQQNSIISITEGTNSAENRYAEYNVKANTVGIFELIVMDNESSLSNITIDRTPIYLNANQWTIIRVTNNEYFNITNPHLIYRFTPDNQNHYTVINNEIRFNNIIYGLKKIYWYAGSTIPSASNINNIATGFETSMPSWTASNPQSIAATNDTEASTYLYYSFPTEWNVITLDVDKVTEMQLVDEGTFTHNETEYSILRTGRKIAVGTTKNYWAKIENNNTNNEEPDTSIIIPVIPDNSNTLYWYAGSTIPSASNINSIATGSSLSKPNWPVSNPQSIAATNDTEASTYLYYSFPTEWNVVTLDVDKVTEMQLVDEGTFTHNETEYSILRTGRKIAVGTTKNYWAKC